MKLLRWAAVSAALFGLSGAALAADMAVKAPPMMPPPPVLNWTGFYFGFNAGWGFSNFDANIDPAGTVVRDFGIAALSTRTNGPVFGGQIGYNYQFNPNWVLGIEGDFDGAGLTGTTTVITPSRVPGFTNGFTATDRINELATIRGRIGYTWGPGMVYFTGGGAWENATHNFMVSDGFLGQSVGGSFDTTRSGFVIGGGLEWMFAQHWTARAEFLFYDFSSNNGTGTFGFTGCGVGCGANAFAIDRNISVLRLGANYKF